MATTDFNFTFGIDKFGQCLTDLHNTIDWYAAIDAKLGIAPNNINTIKRVAAFLAQCGHESGDFMDLTENLNYSAAGLLATFPSHFTQDQANQYARKPEAIANHVYANRMGNGPELSGDGWKFRGRGVIQITGKDEYTGFATDMYGTYSAMIMNNPDIIVLNPSNALDTGLWFWKKHNLNVIADNEDIKTMTRIINGGEIGYDDRLARYLKYKGILGS